MLAQHRRSRILDLIKEEGSARVTDLAGMFEVSEVTIRQDLERLAQDNLITREHGGAFLKTIPDLVSTLSLDHAENMELKRAIGERAAALIQSGQSIILDSGTTTTEIARNLADKHELTVITTAVNIALMLGSRPGIEVMLAGGEFKPPTLSLTGQKAADFFTNVHVDTAFMAVAGVSVEAGLTYPGFNDLPLKRAIAQAASKVYLVADSTKIGRKAFARLGGVELIDSLITDSHITDEDRGELEQAGLEVLTA